MGYASEQKTNNQSSRHNGRNKKGTQMIVAGVEAPSEYPEEVVEVLNRYANGEITVSEASWFIWKKDLKHLPTIFQAPTVCEIVLWNMAIGNEPLPEHKC